MLKNKKEAACCGCGTTTDFLFCFPQKQKATCCDHGGNHASRHPGHSSDIFELFVPSRVVLNVAKLVRVETGILVSQQSEV